MIIDTITFSAFSEKVSFDSKLNLILNRISERINQITTSLMKTDEMITEDSTYQQGAADARRSQSISLLNDTNQSCKPAVYKYSHQLR